MPSNHNKARYGDNNGLSQSMATSSDRMSSHRESPVHSIDQQVHRLSAESDRYSTTSNHPNDLTIMAHDSHRNRPVGPIIDHPAFTNYEFSQQVSNALNIHVGTEIQTAIAMELAIHGPGSVRNAPNDRFLSHQPDLTLAAHARDALDVELEATRVADQRWTDRVLNERETRTLTRENELDAAGVPPEAPGSVWEDARGIEHGRLISLA
jgi:hypothetical protein